MATTLIVGPETTMHQESFADRSRQLEQEKKAEAEIIKKEKEDAKKSPFEKFYQVNQANSKYLTKLAVEQPKALAILLFVIENMDGYNALMASYKVFQEKFDISRTTASNCIKYLKEHGFLYVYKSGTSNVYVVNNTLVWKSWGKNTKYCKFPANIILSESEQEKDDLKKQRINAIIYEGDLVDSETGEILS
ncbi:replication/maintenance protein RepL [uncultured Lactobacillus sp.]|uniref:replication/maintenance protein RepL n=1 Tax=uncultured Lactobacillus sp. TaxID=153152 RepID=UPI00261BBA83|nr:replication/maintenance protein RepL [uncultured Lactobacillus sp.]